MVFARLLQGAFGAALVPLSQSVMLDAYPPEQRGQAMAIWGMGVMLGPDPRPGARRLPHRPVFLALGVPDQPAGRHRHRARPDAVHGRDQEADRDALRLVRLHRARHRHRLAATDARPRRAGRLVRLDRDHRRADRLDRRLLLLLRAFADHRRAVRALRAVQGPQLRRRLPVHGDDRRVAVRHHGADHAVHAEPAGLSDHDRGLRARLARRRHADRDDGGRAAAQVRRGAHPGVLRPRADGGDALPHGRLHHRHVDADHRRHRHHPGRRPRPRVRAALHGRVRHAARRTAQQRHRRC